MKYKVGDEVLVKAKIVSGKIIANTKNCYRVSIGSSYFDISEDSIIPIPDMTAEEAWDVARKIETMRSDTLLEIFGIKNIYYVMHDISPQQAKAKIEAWEQEKNIRVGDEVISKKETYRSEERGLVVCINSVSQIGVNYPGNEFVWYGKDAIKKTGRHIDFDKILEQIGESDA